MFQISQFIKRMTVFFFGFHLTHKVPVMKIKSFVCVVVCVTHSEPLSLMVIIQELTKNDRTFIVNEKFVIRITCLKHKKFVVTCVVLCQDVDKLWG